MAVANRISSKNEVLRSTLLLKKRTSSISPKLGFAETSTSVLNSFQTNFKTSYG
jgi:hypothetical protein